MLTVELLSFAPASQRANGVMLALAQAVAPHVRVTRTSDYVGRSDVLALWGPGAPDRVAPMAAQIAAGGHVVAMDLAYWHRDRKFRVSIDAAHPQAWVMRQNWPSGRLAADQVPIRETWKPEGPVIIAGIGRKARAQYGEDAVQAWERRMIAQITDRWPRRKVLYRKKQSDAPVPSGIIPASNAPIDTLLTGASLVVTWHSNVAVDAIRMGIPVICRDGAAAAVCAATLGPDDPQPLASDVRDRFLRNLAYFQWEPREAASFWRWLPQVLA